MGKGYTVRKRSAHQVSKRPDPLVDRIMENQGGDIDEQRKVETRGLVTLMVPIDPNDPRGDCPIDLSLNGHSYRLARGKMTTIPKELAEQLIWSSRQTSRVFDGRANRGMGVRLDQGGNTIDNLEEEIHERFKVIIERED